MGEKSLVLAPPTVSSVSTEIPNVQWIVLINLRERDVPAEVPITKLNYQLKRFISELSHIIGC
jgi:hypothetical protein